MQQNKSINYLLIVLGIFIIVVVVALLMFGPTREEENEAEMNIVEDTSVSTPVKGKSEVIVEEPINTVKIDAPEPTGTPARPDKTPFNPEDQPRTYAADDFTLMSDLPEGFVTEDVILTRNGIELKPLAEGEEPHPRYGMLHSPPQEMHFQSNAVSPLWKEETDEGTSVFVEVSLSPDGENWGLWHPIYVDDDAGSPAEFYPDGTRNPHYGFIPGGVIFQGMRQFKYYRYRVTLYSEVDGSPVFSAIHMYYQDSTLGKGRLAELDEDTEEDSEK